MNQASPDRVPKDVYQLFIASLFTNRLTLAVGALIHALTFVVVAEKTRSFAYLVLAGLILGTFAGRITTFRWYDRLDKSRLSFADLQNCEWLYVVGAAATTSLLGFASAYAIYGLGDGFAQLICVSVTMASLVSIVGRNYGSKWAVDLQTLTCCLPIIIASLLTLDGHLIFLSILLIPFGLTTRITARSVRENLYDNIVARQATAQIATRFDVALNNMPHGLIMVDRDNRIQVINRKACDLLKIGDPVRLKDRDLGAVLRYGARYSFMDASQPKLILRQISQVSEGNLSRVLIHFPEDLSLEFSASHRSDGGVVLIFEDVSSWVKAEQKILHMVRFDALTGLPNREYFSQLVADHIAGSSPKDACVGFMILDVDEFKHVNDLRGQIAGDRLLCAIASRLRALAPDDIVGRLAGDEFVIFLRQRASSEELEHAIHDLHGALQGDYNVDGNNVPASLSAGYLLFPGEVFSMSECSVKADLALCESKSRNRGAITAFEREMDGRYIEQQKLKSDLRAAVAAGALSLVYQPMFRPDGSQILCAEALARWIHPQRGAIPPDIFIGLAEDMGIISDITRFVLMNACAECMTWPDDIDLSVNLSAQDLRDADVLSLVCAALDASGLPASRLHLEITESCLIEEPATVRLILAELRSKGITIAIDDFGTGFSSLSYLDTLPLDIVKIDRSFVRNIVEDGRRLKLLRGTVNLARELGLKIVTEGVETQEQLLLINEQNSTDLVQGYVFSPPIPSENIGALSRSLQTRGVSPRVA